MLFIKVCVELNIKFYACFFSNQYFHNSKLVETNPHIRAAITSFHMVYGYVNILVARENSYPSGPAQNEHNNKLRTAPLVPGDRINDITWRGSKCLCILQMSNA